MTIKEIISRLQEVEDKDAELAILSPDFSFTISGLNCHTFSAPTLFIEKK